MIGDGPHGRSHTNMDQEPTPYREATDVGKSEPDSGQAGRAVMVDVR
jgi:hypothetical protein